MIDLFKDDDIDDIIKQSVEIHDMILEKIMTKKYIFIIGNKETLLGFIQDFGLDAEPLQINGDNMMSLKRKEGGFQHTYFIKKDDKLRHATNVHGSENPNSIKTDFDSLIGFELDGINMSYLAFKKGEEFNVKNAERYVNLVYPIARVGEIDEFNKRANEVIESCINTIANDNTKTSQFYNLLPKNHSHCTR